ncbi:MAG: ABC transporter permease [Spirochaetes bacterium]|nr:ABC transporter permease [Spirochaetota bacterium]
MTIHLFPMCAFIKHIVFFIVAFAVAILIIQVLIFFIPGDPAMMMAGDYASANDIALIRKELGLDRPFYLRYAMTLKNLASFDLGKSIHTEMPVINLILERLPATLYLASLSMLIAAFGGLFFGIFAALNKGNKIDNGILWISSLFISTPIFITCLILTLIFSHALQMLPPSGKEGYDIRFVILPSFALASRSLALTIRIVRNELLGVLSSNYIKAAKAMGIRKWRIVFVHALRNIAIPVITIVLLDFGAYLGGAVVTETVFAWPGMGRLLIQALAKRDLPLVQGIVIFSTGIFIFIGQIIEFIRNFEKNN